MMEGIDNRPRWKQFIFLTVLLTQAAIGSPVGTGDRQLNTYSKGAPLIRQTDGVVNAQKALLEEDIFGPSLTQRHDRRKRTLYDAWKKAKKIKLFSLGEASASAAKSFGKSIIQTVASLGLKAIIFNFLYTKINQVLDFKNRMINNLEQKNREQNSQLLGIDDSASDRVIGSSSTESPVDDVPDFNPDKISLAIPDGLFAPSFTLANGVSQVVGTLVQNKASRTARLVEALKPFLSSSVGQKSSKREAEKTVNDYAQKEKKTKEEAAPIKSSYEALTHS